MRIHFHILIPSRYRSTRLPGKSLLEIAGKPMIQHVVERCQKSDAASVVVATDDRRIYDIVIEFGAQAVMTSADHNSGSDRVAEAVAYLGLNDNEIIVNVQGDEPDIPPVLVNQVAAALEADHNCHMCTAITDIEHESELQDPAVVKVVTDINDYALYFSRSSIPFVRDSTGRGVAPPQRHLGIYGYRAGYIKNFASQAVSPLEESEKLEQLRALWYGDRILCIKADKIPTAGVDTEQDLERMRKHFNPRIKTAKLYEP